jgi:predicted amidohydrolase YtcJ
MMIDAFAPLEGDFRGRLEVGKAADVATLAADVCRVQSSAPGT